MNEVYRVTSGYIHFSDRHIQAAVELSDSAPTRMSFALGPLDRDKADTYYRKIMAAFLHINMMIHTAAEDRLDILVAAAGRPLPDLRTCSVLIRDHAGMAPTKLHRHALPRAPGHAGGALRRARAS